MTTTPTSGAADLLDLIEAYAEARHRQGHSSYNAQTATALQAVKDALAAGQATAAQQGAYAALSESFLGIPDVQDESGINAYYSREVVLECIDAALASHGKTLRLLTQKEKDSLGRRAEGMDGNEWDQWVQEKFAQVNGLRVQGGSYEWDWE